MEAAKVGIFEDDEDWREILGGIVKDNGHTVATSATNIEEARTTIRNLKVGDF